jgi:hypothetical protein
MRLPWAVSMQEKVAVFKHVGNLARRVPVCHKDGEFASGTSCLQASRNLRGCKPRATLLLDADNSSLYRCH